MNGTRQNIRFLRSTALCLLGGLAWPAASHAQTPDAPPLAWSEPDAETALDGKTVFHGPFTNQAVRVSCDRLAEHAFVRVEADVLILRSWDGSTPVAGSGGRADGPDYFRLSLVGGPILLSTTFSNVPNEPGFYLNSQHQNFPSPVPGDSVPFQTGATAKNTLGYNYPWPGPPQLYPMDATYHLDMLVPHRAARLDLCFEAMGLSEMQDESWGVREVRVTPLAAAQIVVPSDQTIDQAFTTALDVTSTDQPAAVSTLVSGMNATVAWLGRMVTPQGLDEKQVQAALADLAGDDSKIDARAEARDTLFHFGPAVEPFLRDARLAWHGEPRHRAEKVLQRLGVEPITDPNLRRVALATRVLEIIGTPEALALRHKLVAAP